MKKPKKYRRYGEYYLEWIQTGENQEGYWKVYDLNMTYLGLCLENGELESGLREYEEA